MKSLYIEVDISSIDESSKMTLKLPMKPYDFEEAIISFDNPSEDLDLIITRAELHYTPNYSNFKNFIVLNVEDHDYWKAIATDVNDIIISALQGQYKYDIEEKFAALAELRAKEEGYQVSLYDLCMEIGDFHRDMVFLDYRDEEDLAENRLFYQFVSTNFDLSPSQEREIMSVLDTKKIYERYSENIHKVSFGFLEYSGLGFTP